VVPDLYTLKLQVNTETNLFNGSVEIDVTTQKELDYFIVHAADILTIKETRVQQNGNNVAVKETFRYSPLQFFVIRLTEKAAPNKYKLIFDYESNLLLGGLTGLYRSSYERDGKTIGLAASQFQSTSARKAFPSFDEPSFKPEFDITIIHDNANTLTVTNMDTKEIQVDSPITGWTTTTYNRTPKMVTYLVAILVSDFVCRSDTQSFSYKIHVCASPVKEYKLQYALDMTPKVFKQFETYLDYNYTLPKSHLVAIPDFSAGAMENWGLVKFRETALLWTPEEDTSATKMSVTSIIAHELAHMVSII
jgi:aminopeptidase N